MLSIFRSIAIAALAVFALFGAAGVAAAAPATSVPGDGTYVVGVDIAPGTYRSSSLDEYGCYWERLSGLSGEFDNIIANDYAEGALVVTVRASDAAFSTSGCATWVRQTDPAPAPAAVAPAPVVPAPYNPFGS